MSNRFHSKYHRQNHHTYPSDTNPDSGHDPIASPDSPFRGDFVLSGALSASVPATSAYAAVFTGGKVGIGTGTPNTDLTIMGNVSASDIFITNKIAVNSYKTGTVSTNIGYFPIYTSTGTIIGYIPVYSSHS